MKAAVSLPVVLSIALAGADGAGAAERALRAGVHAAGISPRKLPVILSGGFLAREVKTVSGPLYARALALDDGENRVVIAVADSLMMPRELLDEVKEAAAKTTGIPAGRMLISATHTHSAPPVMGALGTDANPEYAAVLRAGLVEAIEGAARDLQPAQIGWAVVEAPEHTHCRRWILRPDKVRRDPFGEPTVRAHMHPGYLNPDFIGPAGPVDPGLTVLAVRRRDGRPAALLANYSMHYVGGDGGVSPDYYGPFAAEVRRLLGVEADDAGFIAMMSQGTSGDQHWMDYGRPERKTTPAAYAVEMARAAHGAWRAVRFRDRVPVRMAGTTLSLARRVPDGRRLGWARGIADALPGGIPRNQAEVYAREQVLLAAEPRREIRLQALRIGDVGIAAFPAEVFAITGLKIKARSPLRPSFNIELANGAEGYIPPPEQHRLGGYTTWPARTAALEVEAEPKIVEALLELLEQVAGKPRGRMEAAGGAYAEAVLDARPAAYWRGEEIDGDQALDSSGNGRGAAYEGAFALYLEGAPSPGLAAAGRINRAPHFAGGSLRAAIGGLPERYTVAFWFWNGLPADVRPVTGCLFSRGGLQVQVGGTGGATGRLVLRSGERVLEGRARIEPKTWHLAVLRRDGERTSLYLDGDPGPEVSGELPAGGDAEIRLGAGGTAGASFEGKLDEIAVFGRALRPAEIARLQRFAAGTAAVYPSR